MQFHGNRCEDAHDLADIAFVYGDCKIELPTEDDTLMTTWQDDGDLPDAIFDCFCACPPSSGFLETLSGFYVLSVGTNLENQQLRAMITSLDTTLRQAVERPTRPR